MGRKLIDALKAVAAASACFPASWVFRTIGGVGKSAQQVLGGSAASESVAFTPTQPDSAIVWGVSDFAATAAGSLAPGASHAREAVQFGSSYTYYVADLVDQPSPLSVLYGLTGAGATTGPFSIVVLEILAHALPGTTTSSPAVIKKRLSKQQALGAE